MITKQDFIDPKDIEIEGQLFTVSRIPAFDAAPVYDTIVRERGIIPQNEKLALLSRCSVKTEQGDVILDKPILINTYIRKYQVLSKLVDEAFELNFASPESGNASQK